MDPFDCQTFLELCMDYRGAQGPTTPQECYERLQAYCRRHMNASYNQGHNDGKAYVEAV